MLQKNVNELGESDKQELPIYQDVDTVPLSLIEQLSGHWRVMIEQKRRQHDVNTLQIVIGQLLTIVAVGIVSILVEANKEALLLIGGTLILYPSLVDLMVSNAAVLTASIHHDIDQESFSRGRYIALTTLRAVLVAILASLLIGVLAGLLGWLIFGTSFLQTLALSIVAGSLTGAFGLPLLVVITLVTRRIQANPDDINPPVINTIFNILALLAIGFASRWLS